MSSVIHAHIALVAGEHSGDIMGAALIKALNKRFKHLRFSGVGGPRMQSAGMELLEPASTLSVLGFWQPFKRLPRLLALRKRLYRHYKQERPDIFIGIDAPDFTLKLEEQLRAHGLVTMHCISPSVWAWRKWRIKQIKRAVNMMLTLFPFEADFYRKHSVPVHFIGHPMASSTKNAPSNKTALAQLGLTQLSKNKAQKIIAILPGSRISEIKSMFPLFYNTALLSLAKDEHLYFIVSVAEPRYEEYMRSVMIQQYSNSELGSMMHEHILFSHKSSQTIISAADAVLVSSGTASLETLLLDKPMVISYKVDWLTYSIVRLLSHIKFYGLPNLLMGRLFVPEYMQKEAKPDILSAALLKQLNMTMIERSALLAEYAKTRHSLQRDTATIATDVIASFLSARRV